MNYQVLVGTRAAKDLDELPVAIRRRIRGVIDGLASEPRPAGAQAMTGMSDTYRIRVGDYRLVYAIDDAEKMVVIARIGHRRDVYRRL